MSSYLVIFKCTGAHPCIANKIVEAESVAAAITAVNNYHARIGRRYEREIIAVYEEKWRNEKAQR